MQPSLESGFTETFSRELAAVQLEFGDCAPWDILFLAFLRTAAPFGHLRVGPISIDLGVVEETVRRRGVPYENNMGPFSRSLMREVRESGRKRVDALHYLMVFMKCGEGLPREVFGELGVTPDQVERALREPPSQGPDLLLTPEEVADYLKVHVETVRGWIRSGRLPARRIAGLRALRVRQADANALLQPLESAPSPTVDRVEEQE